MLLDEVADLIGISRQMLSMIVNGHARVTPDVAALLGKVLGNGPGLWLRLQADWDAEHIDPAIRAKVRGKRRIPSTKREKCRSTNAFTRERGLGLAPGYPRV